MDVPWKSYSGLVWATLRWVCCATRLLTGILWSMCCGRARVGCGLLWVSLVDVLWKGCANFFKSNNPTVLRLGKNKIEKNKTKKQIHNPTESYCTMHTNPTSSCCRIFLMTVCDAWPPMSLSSSKALSCPAFRNKREVPKVHWLSSISQANIT